jgi:hypothetical protein
MHGATVRNEQRKSHAVSHTKTHGSPVNVLLPSKFREMSLTTGASEVTGTQQTANEES